METLKLICITLDSRRLSKKNSKDFDTCTITLVDHIAISIGFNEYVLFVVFIWDFSAMLCHYTGQP